jgi:hypothetical protein
MPLKMEKRGAAAAVNVADMMSGSSNSVYRRCMCSVIFMVMMFMFFSVLLISDFEFELKTGQENRDTRDRRTKQDVFVALLFTYALKFMSA